MKNLREENFEHAVQFYKTEDFLLDSLANFVMDGLQTNARCIIIATPAHRSALDKLLREKDVDIKHAEMMGTYITLDAASTLSYFMERGLPNPQSFNEIIGSLIPYLSIRPTRAFGEMVALLWQAGNIEGAIRLEELWNNLGAIRNFSLFCAYPIHHFVGEHGEVSQARVLAVHSHSTSQDH